MKKILISLAVILFIVSCVSFVDARPHQNKTKGQKYQSSERLVLVGPLKLSKVENSDLQHFSFEIRLLVPRNEADALIYEVKSIIRYHFIPRCVVSEVNAMEKKYIIEGDVRDTPSLIESMRDIENIRYSDN